MEDNLKKQVEDVVSAIFDSKEKETIRKKTEDALRASALKIEELASEVEVATEVVVEKDTEISELKTKIETADVEKAELIEKHGVETKEITDAKTSVEEDLEKVSLELSTMKKEITADKRMVELESAGVVREESDVQKIKIMDMSDEDFTSYKEELVSIKAKVLSSLKVKEDVDTDEEDTNTPPVEVDPDKTSQAALNLESTPSQDLAEKYADLGKAMAEAITKN